MPHGRCSAAHGKPQHVYRHQLKLLRDALYMAATTKQLPHILDQAPKAMRRTASRGAMA